MKKICLFVLFFFNMFCLQTLQAEILMSKKNGSIFVDRATTNEIVDLFKEYKFDNYSKIQAEIPRIFMKKMPIDWKNVPQSHQKNVIFIKMILPLVLKVNEDILKERAEIEDIYEQFKKNKNLDDRSLKFIEQKAKKYDEFTRLQGEQRIALLIKKLLEKVDAVPPSIMVASAGIYTDWGISRLATEANSLYLTEIWYKDEGLQPLNDEGADYRYKIYSSLEESIADQALKINSHINYDYLREARKINRNMGYPPYSPQLTVQMMLDNNLKNIAGLIDYTLTFYKMKNTDFLPSLVNIY